MVRCWSVLNLFFVYLLITEHLYDCALCTLPCQMLQGLTPQWPSILFRGRRNTPCHFMLQKLRLAQVSWGALVRCKLSFSFHGYCRMLSGAQDTFVYRHEHQNGTLDVRDNIQVLHLTPVSCVFDLILWS